MDERAEEATATEVWVASHEDATPGKRLTWHLSHFNLRASQCHFAGKPLGAGRDALPAGEPPPHWRPERELSGAGPSPGIGFVDASAGGGGHEGEAAGAGEGEVVGKRVRWRFAASSIVLALDIKG
jgi:hypothetical protein